jgi:hypothetical protein
MSVKAIFQTAAANVSRLLGRLFGSDPTFGPLDWHVDGNAGINPGAHFLGTTENAALVLRTNNIPRLWINGSEPLYASGSGHVGIGFGLNSPEALLHIHNYDNAPAISTDLIVSHQGAPDGYGGTSISLRVLGNEMASIQAQNDAPDGGSLRFHTRNFANVSERMRIRSSGQVGVGTSQPESALTVEGLTEGDAILFKHPNQPGEVAVGTSSAGLSGGVATFGPNGIPNAAMVCNNQNADHGAVVVYDAAGIAKAYMVVDSGGTGWVVADIKSFRVAHPDKPDTDIVYAAIEGPEAAAYVRGTAHLSNGEAVIDLPEHFTSIASREGLTVQLTPNSATSLGLAVEEKSTERIIVRELSNGKGDYDFDWEAKCIRKGYEDYQPIRSHQYLELGHVDRQAKDDGEETA